jgi:hypothetical protein
MTTLVDFLTARIDEDEAAALRAGPMPADRSWTAAAGRVMDATSEREIVAGAAEGVIPHLVRHDPAHVLALCEAHRGLIERAQVIEDQRAKNDPDAPSQPLGDDTLRVLAEAWADHPDYDDAWRP